MRGQLPRNLTDIIFCISMYFIYQFLHLFHNTGHLFYIKDLKILFLKFNWCITRINGERQDIVKLITCPLIKLQFFF